MHLIKYTRRKWVRRNARFSFFLCEMQKKIQSNQNKQSKNDNCHFHSCDTKPRFSGDTFYVGNTQIAATQMSMY